MTITIINLASACEVPPLNIYLPYIQFRTITTYSRHLFINVHHYINLALIHTTGQLRAMLAPLILPMWQFRVYAQFC
jgi:hypothetical protein